jgi:hypothetical protein
VGVEAFFTAGSKDHRNSFDRIGFSRKARRSIEMRLAESRWSTGIFQKIDFISMRGRGGFCVSICGGGRSADGADSIFRGRFPGRVIGDGCGGPGTRAARRLQVCPVCQLCLLAIRPVFVVAGIPAGQGEGG